MASLRKGDARRARATAACADDRPRWPRRRSRRDPGAASVKILRVRPAGEAGHDVELAEQQPDHLVGVVFRAQMLELAQYPRDRAVGVGDCPLGIVLALALQALAVPQE